MEQLLGAVKASGIHIPRIGEEGGGASDCSGLAQGPTGCPILLMTSPNTPPLMTSSYNLTCPLLLQCALRGQKGLQWHGGGSFGSSLSALETDATATIQAHVRENTD